MILPEKRNRTIHLIRATAIPGRQRHGTEKNRSTIRKRRAIPRRESSFPVFLFFPRPSFRHSPTGIFNFSPSSAPSPSSGRHPGILCGTLFHFDGALTKPVEILRKQLLLQEISLNKSARFRKHIIPVLHQKEIFHAGSHCKTRNHPFSGILYPGFRGLQGLAGNGFRNRQAVWIRHPSKRKWTGISPIHFRKPAGIFPGRFRPNAGAGITHESVRMRGPHVRSARCRVPGSLIPFPCGKDILKDAFHSGPPHKDGIPENPAAES